MIVLFHNGINPLVYENTITKKLYTCKDDCIKVALIFIAKSFPKELIIWCHESLKEYINYESLTTIFHHQLILSSYSISSEYIIPQEIGYVDQNCFVNVNRQMNYPTWLMSSDIGGGHARIFREVQLPLKDESSFDEFLCSLAKFSMAKGVFCYSNPNLLLENNKNLLKKGFSQKTKYKLLFSFVRKHYKIQWSIFLFLNLLVYENKICFISFLQNLFSSENNLVNPINVEIFEINSIKNKINKENFKVDVLIPTLGRKEYLHNVLKDLTKQILLPRKVIIVEQNPALDSSSELDFLDHQWPFKIDHTFTNRLGACNARNIAMSKVTGDWVFFADDDIRFDHNLLLDSLNAINKYGLDTLLISCLQKGENIKSNIVHQSNHFGSGTCIVMKKVIENLSFKKEHEFGYGEDKDFGMQIRNKGFDIIHFPTIQMHHLKAPSGGFRVPVFHLWKDEIPQPKPSPTVMAYNFKHLTEAQLKSSKTLLFFNFYKNQTIKNPYSYFINFNKAWSVSQQWAKKILSDED